MVNLAKWEEIDFFDAKVGDKLKGYIEIGPTETHVIKGKVTYMHSTSDKLEGRIHVEKDGETHALIRNRLMGKQEGTTLYRRKELTQVERDEQFQFPEKLGAIVSAKSDHASSRYGASRAYHVWDGGEWSTADTSISTSEFRKNFKEFELVRKGIKID